MKDEIDSIDNITTQDLRQQCNHCLAMIKEKVGDEYKKLHIDLEHDLEDEYDYLCGYCDHLNYEKDTEILYAFGNLLESYEVTFSSGKQKRFAIQTKEQMYEGDTLKELISDWIDTIKNQILQYERKAYKRYGIVLPPSIDQDNVDAIQLYEFMKDQYIYIMRFGIEYLYLLAYHDRLPVLSDPNKMEEIANNLKTYEQLKQTHPDIQWLSYDFLVNYDQLELA